MCLWCPPVTYANNWIWRRELREWCISCFLMLICEGVLVCQSACVKTCHPSAAVLNTEPFASSYEGIQLPISLWRDPNWRAIFNATHRRDERKQWAAQAGCRGPIKLLEFTSCHHTIPDTKPPRPSPINPRWQKGHWVRSCVQCRHKYACTRKQILTIFSTNPHRSWWILNMIFHTGKQI